MNSKIFTATLLLIILVGAFFYIQTVKADPVTILSQSSYLDSTGSYWIVGEVQNLGTSPVEYVWIESTLYDVHTTFIAVKEGLVIPNVILPNHKAPFFVFLNDKTQSSKVDHYTLDVNVSLTTSAPPLGLRILSQSSYIDSIGSMRIIGEVENTGATNATNTRVFATCYDSNGKVVAVDFTPELSEIPSGQKSSYELKDIFSDRAPLVNSYALSAESAEYECFDYPTVTLSPTPPPTPTSTPTLTPTPTQSQSTSPSQSTVTPSPSPTPTLSPTPSTSIPEFPSIAILSFFVVLALLSAIIYKRKIAKERAKAS